MGLSTKGIVEVTLQEAQAIISAIWKKNPQHGFFLYGPSGVGKSAMVEALAEKDEGFYPLYGHSFNPSEVNGILYVDEKTGLAKWAKLACLPHKEHACPDTGIICIEEPNLAPPSIQGELMKLIYARVSGDYHVPPGYRIIGCGNRPEDRANINPMPYPLRVRWTWLHIRPDTESWIQYFAIPRGIHWTISGFLKFKPDSFHEDAPPDGPGACGRTWERLNDALQCNMTGEELEAMVYGTVGPRIGPIYLAYMKVAELLPDMREVAFGNLDWWPDPAKYGEDNANALLYSSIMSLVSIYKEMKTTKDKKIVSGNIINKFVPRLGKETGFWLMRELYRSDKNLTKICKEDFDKWASENGNYF